MGEALVRRSRRGKAGDVRSGLITVVCLRVLVYPRIQDEDDLLRVECFRCSPSDRDIGLVVHGEHGLSELTLLVDTIQPGRDKRMDCRIHGIDANRVEEILLDLLKRCAVLCCGDGRIGSNSESGLGHSRNDSCRAFLCYSTEVLGKIDRFDAGRHLAVRCDESVLFKFFGTEIEDHLLQGAVRQLRADRNGIRLSANRLTGDSNLAFPAGRQLNASRSAAGTNPDREDLGCPASESFLNGIRRAAFAEGLLISVSRIEDLDLSERPHGCLDQDGNNTVNRTELISRLGCYVEIPTRTNLCFAKVKISSRLYLISFLKNSSTTFLTSLSVI